MWKPSSERINVLVWLSEPLLRVGVRATLADAPLLRVLDELQPQDGVPQVMVTDLASAQQLARRDAGMDLPLLSARTRILVLSSQAREHALAAAFRMGAHGIVLSRCTAAELVEAVRTLARGSSYVCPEVARRLVANSPRDDLTEREEEVLRLLARGQCNKTIARQLGIAVGTVKTHVKGILAKLEASSRTEAASIAAEKGIVDIPEFQSRRVWPAIGAFNPGLRTATALGELVAA